MATIDQLLTAARSGIERLTPAETLVAMRRGAVVVDIRPGEQRRRDGLVPGARIVDRNVLEWRLDPASEWRIPALARRDRLLILVCDEGYQSSLAAATLCRFGLEAADVIGGVQLWRAEGLPLDPFEQRADEAAKESNLPSGGLHRPAGFEGQMGHQTPAAPREAEVGSGYGARDRRG